MRHYQLLLSNKILYVSRSFLWPCPEGMSLDLYSSKGGRSQSTRGHLQNKMAAQGWRCLIFSTLKARVVRHYRRQLKVSVYILLGLVFQVIPNVLFFSARF